MNSRFFGGIFWEMETSLTDITIFGYTIFWTDWKNLRKMGFNNSLLSQENRSCVINCNYCRNSWGSSSGNCCYYPPSPSRTGIH